MGSHFRSSSASSRMCEILIPRASNRFQCCLPFRSEPLWKSERSLSYAPCVSAEAAANGRLWLRRQTWHGSNRIAVGGPANTLFSLGRLRVAHAIGKSGTSPPSLFLPCLTLDFRWREITGSKAQQTFWRRARCVFDPFEERRSRPHQQKPSETAAMRSQAARESRRFGAAHIDFRRGFHSTRRSVHSRRRAGAAAGPCLQPKRSLGPGRATASTHLRPASQHTPTPLPTPAGGDNVLELI